MARRRRPILTEVELEFMQVVRDAAEVTTEGVPGALPRRGRNTARRQTRPRVRAPATARQPDGPEGRAAAGFFVAHGDAA